MVPGGSNFALEHGSARHAPPNGEPTSVSICLGQRVALDGGGDGEAAEEELVVPPEEPPAVLVAKEEPALFPEELPAVLVAKELSDSPEETRAVRVAKEEAEPPVKAVSDAFQALLDLLVDQHLSELAGVPTRGRTRSRPSVDSSRKSQTSKTSEKAQVGEKSHALNRMSSLNNLLRRRSRIVEVNASDILEAWEVTESQQLGMMSDPILQRFPLSDASSENGQEQPPASGFQRLQLFLQSSTYELAMALILFLNVAWMASALQLDGSMAGAVLSGEEAPFTPDVWHFWEGAFETGDLIFAILFVVDVLVRIFVLRLKFWQVWMNYLDMFVSFTSLLEVYLAANTDTTLPNAVLIRLIRIGKLARAIRVLSMSTVLQSLQLLVKCLSASGNILFWSFILLAFVQCVAGMVVSMLVYDYIRDPSVEMQHRDHVYQYYGTFSRFTVFVLLYRCVLGFAVLNVVNSVFVQQTMKTASSDEELAFRQKEREIAMYHRKVRKLFTTMDCTGDGAINLEEFAKLVQSPKLKFWMSQLELEYHDLLSLFEFLDNGDGQITLSEFIDGASRLRGSAKALDIWRMETKLEVLFEEVLNRLKTDEERSAMSEAGDNSDENPAFSSVEEAFNNSAYQHIRTTSRCRPVDSSNPGSPNSITRNSSRKSSRISHLPTGNSEGTRS